MFLEINSLSWNLSLKVHQDIDYILRCLLASKNIVYVQDTYAIYVGHNQNQISDSYQYIKPPYNIRFYSLIKLQLLI